jgi:hypothetical protein
MCGFFGKNITMGFAVEQDSKNSKTVFYIVIILIMICNIGFLFYYAHLMPLHGDEAGFWFNWTNKSILNRFFNNNVSISLTPPWHGVTIYLAKISIYIFGNTGIGLRLPVIFFGVLSSWLLYIFTKQITEKTEVALLAATFLFLNPFFSHYSHELRGYSSLFFFSLCSYYCVFKVTRSQNNIRYFVFLFLSFFGCYISNLASPLFFSTFLVTIFIFKFLGEYTKSGRMFQHLNSLTYQKLFLFSFISSMVFGYLFFYFDASYFKVMKGANFYGGQSSNLTNIPDFFSSFLGYKYLDDSAAEIYRYPGYIWFCSLAFFLVGVIKSFRKKEFFALFFLILLAVTALFYSISPSNIHTRSAVFLLPFFVIFQAVGAVALTKFILISISSKETATNKLYWILTGFTILYFSFLHIGKYNKLDLKAGNPYELARDYLNKHSGPNDLIISSIQDTFTAFYFSNTIRKKIKNIYENNKLENIIFLNNLSKDEIILNNYYGRNPIAFNSENGLSKLNEFENHGKRGHKIKIYKKSIIDPYTIDLNFKLLLKAEFIGDNNRCTKSVSTTKEGFFLTCPDSRIVCSESKLNLSTLKTQNHKQLVIFKHINLKGSFFRTLAFLEPIPKNSLKTFDPRNFLTNKFKINPLAQNIADLDLFAKNIMVLNYSLQTLSTNQNLVACMVGDLFNNNSLIQGIKVFNF